MVYWKELKRDVATTAMAKGNTAPENFDIYSFIEHDRFDFYLRKTKKGCHVHAMCKMLLVWAKTDNTSAYLLRFDIKLKKSRFGFDLVTVLISSFFNVEFGVFSKVNHIYMEKHWRIFTSLAHSFTKIKRSESTYLCLMMPLQRKVPDVTKEQIYVNVISR